MSSLRNHLKLQGKNGYIFPYIIWVSLVCLSFTTVMVEIYQNSLMIYDQLNHQIDEMTAIQMTRERVKQEVEKSNKIERTYDFTFPNSTVQLRHYDTINHNAYFIASVYVNRLESEHLIPIQLNLNQ